MGRLMWNITPENIQLAKEELKGRRAAIEARYAEELKAVTSDLEEIETLERVALAFAGKHLLQVDLADTTDEDEVQPAPLEATLAEPPAAESDSAAKVGMSRWRLRANMADV